MFSATLRNTWLLSAALRSTPQHSRAPASLVRWFAAESRGSSEVLLKGAENNDGAAENNDGAAQRNTGVAGQTPVRGKQVILQYSLTFECVGNKLVNRRSFMTLSVRLSQCLSHIRGISVRRFIEF